MDCFFLFNRLFVCFSHLKQNRKYSIFLDGKIKQYFCLFQTFSVLIQFNFYFNVNFYSTNGRWKIIWRGRNCYSIINRDARRAWLNLEYATKSHKVLECLQELSRFSASRGSKKLTIVLNDRARRGVETLSWAPPSRLASKMQQPRYLNRLRYGIVAICNVSSDAFSGSGIGIVLDGDISSLSIASVHEKLDSSLFLDKISTYICHTYLLSHIFFRFFSRHHEKHG